MTDEERKVLTSLCETVLVLTKCQQQTDRSWRSLYLALKEKFPEMEKAVADHRKDALFATEQSARPQQVAQSLEAVIEFLRKQDEP